MNAADSLLRNSLLLADFAALVRAPLFWAVIAGAIGISLMLPRGSRFGRTIGAMIASVGFILLATSLPRWTDLGHGILFWIMAGMTTVGAVATISMRSPIYCAIWFGLTLLATAGLFLIQGAQLLGVATVIVYAGAILVTFLFLLMLAQPEGHAYYDRISWAGFVPVVASIVGMLFVGGLTYVVTSAAPPVANADDKSKTVEERRQDVLHEEHTAKLGAQLFSRHLVAVEVAGSLLMVALVGAIVMAMRGRGGAEDSSVGPQGGPRDG